jgi:hypothetical protein
MLQPKPATTSITHKTEIVLQTACVTAGTALLTKKLVNQIGNMPPPYFLVTTTNPFFTRNHMLAIPANQQTNPTTIYANILILLYLNAFISSIVGSLSNPHSIQT